MTILKKISDVLSGKATISENRSSKWPTVRKEYLKNNKICAVCGGTKSLEVHHIKPFSSNPELELDLNNLITLCESSSYGVTCHLLMGHLGNYKNVNKKVIQDSKSWNKKLSINKKE